MNHLSLNKTSKSAIYLGIFLLLAIHGVRNIFIPTLRDSVSMEGRVNLSLAFGWVVTALIIGVVLFIEKNDFTSLGFRKMGWKDWVGAIVVFLIGGSLISATLPLMSRFDMSSTEDGVVILGTMSIATRLLIVVTAAVTEEVLFRGYLLERFNMLTGNIWVSAILSYLIFIFLHLAFWGVGGTIQIALGSIFLYALYLWRRNVVSCMVMHGLNHIVAFLLIPLFL